MASPRNIVYVDTNVIIEILKCQTNKQIFSVFELGYLKVVSGTSVRVLFLRPTALAPSRGMLVVR